MAGSSRRRMQAATLAIAAGLTMAGGLPGVAGAQSVALPPTSALPVPAVAAPDLTGDVPPCAFHWRGQEADIETFLRDAPVVRFEAIPVGITKPRRAYFAEGSPVRSMAWKVLPVKQDGFRESHRAEIAAYRLSRLLGLDMVPPAVERRLERRKGAAVMWIEHVRTWDEKNPPRRAGRHWSHQVSRMKLFDQLIGNPDRNQGNLLHDADGHLFLIDHSRAFTIRTSITQTEAPSQIDRRLWTRMDALHRDELHAALGDVLTSSEINAILKRRDRMRVQVQARVREVGEAIAFLPMLPGEPDPTGAPTARTRVATAMRTPRT